ncbi:HIT family protein [Rurimicrobium arvi]|uniref:HIT family protein n=1 Tax=Rurimicrobium arvi TaxID=2049916 RepID=A0ABP8MK93_9BACT
MASIFSKIISGEIPCFKIAENEHFLAFLDIMPLREGHVLVVPKVEVDKAYELPEAYLASWFQFAQPIARAMEKAFPCKRVGISIIGLEVPHAHMHLVPINTANDLNFTEKPSTPSMDELKRVHEKLMIHLS